MPQKTADEFFHKYGEFLAKQAVTKRAAYGDNLPRAGKILALMYPEGIPVDALAEALVIVRVLDKLVRIANKHIAISKGKTVNETEDPWGDIGGYAMAIAWDKHRGEI